MKSRKELEEDILTLKEEERNTPWWRIIKRIELDRKIVSLLQDTTRMILSELVEDEERANKLTP